MATKTIPIQDVSDWKKNPVLLMLHEHHNAVKEKGGKTYE